MSNPMAPDKSLAAEIEAVLRSNTRTLAQAEAHSTSAGHQEGEHRG